METVEDAQLRDQLVLARSKLWTPELDRLLRRWKRQIDSRRKAHYEIARNLSQRHYLIGIPASIINTVTTTGIFATFQTTSSSQPTDNSLSQFDISVCQYICNVTNMPLYNQPNTTSAPPSSPPGYEQWVRLGMGILAIFGLTLTGVLTFMNYQSDAEAHKTAGDSYDSLYGNIESLMVIPPLVRGDPVNTLQGIRHEYDDIVKKCPNLPEKYQVDLSYVTIDSVPQKVNSNNVPLLPKLRPDDVQPQRDEKSVRLGTEILSNIVNSQTPLPTSRTFRGDPQKDLSSLIQEKNNFDSDDDQEVCLGFDLNQMAAMNNTKSALAMASLAQKQDRQIQSSLFKALEFEMQRLNDSNNIVVGDGGNESVPNTPLSVSMNKSAEIPKPTDTIVNL
jgi:hypothetical protein